MPVAEKNVVETLLEASPHDTFQRHSMSKVGKYNSKGQHKSTINYYAVML